MAPQPFTLSISDAAVADLNARLRLTRFPDAAPGEPWAFGTSVDYARDLIGYWKDRFDWRAQEAALNAFPQFKVPSHDIDLHYLPGKLWDKTWDPEGLLSTIPAIGTALFGVFAGMLLKNRAIPETRKALYLIGAGIAGDYERAGGDRAAH